VTVVTCTSGGRRTVVSRPDAGDAGRRGLDVAITLAIARRENAAARLIAPAAASDPLLALRSDEVAISFEPDRVRDTCAVRWWMAAAADALGDRRAVAAASWWQELYVELRRQAGRDSLPSRVRERLKGMAQGALSRFTARSQESLRFPRRLLREPVDVHLTEQMRSDAVRAAATLGVPADAPLVALEVRSNPETLLPALDLLGSHGYTVVRIGDAGMGPLTHAAVVDVASMTHRTALVELHLLLQSRFIVCGSTEMQWMAYLLDRPCLRLDATDAIGAYPVRGGGLYTLKTPVDLDTGDLLRADDMLTERYYRNQRNYGFRGTSADDIRAAVAEMHEGSSRGWNETSAQAGFRVRTTEAAQVLAPRVAPVARWGSDGGFLGDGRLASAQAARAS
jgi:putative glycosyltransferase (TIGR04372 family)